MPPGESAGKQALFTDYTYDNLGVPKNPENPFYTQPPEFNPSALPGSTSASAAS